MERVSYRHASSSKTHVDASDDGVCITLDTPCLKAKTRRMNFKSSKQGVHYGDVNGHKERKAQIDSVPRFCFKNFKKYSVEKS